jgi:quinol monooxygenase YgiN
MMALVVTVLEAAVAPERGTDLQTVFVEAGNGPLPAGLVRSALLRDSKDPTRWRIETVWESHAALSAMRQAGKPKGVQMFEAAGAVPVLSVFDVVEEVD